MGTDGLGVNVAVLVASGVNLRAGGTWFGRTFDRDETIGRHGSRWEADGSVLFLTALTVEPKTAVAPYVGLGWGNATARRSSFQMDLGVMYVGSPGMGMGGSGMVSEIECESPRGP